PAGSQRLGVVMSGRESRRSLPAKELAACLQAIFRARGGPELVCIGSKAETPLVHRLMRELPRPMIGKVRDLTGATALTDLPDLLSGLDALITPDTGTMHLAAHLGVPVQAFFLSSAWAWETGPYGFGHTVWQALAPCSPCLESVPCPNELACLPAFSHPSFLAHLSGKASEAWPTGLLGCVGMLDDLGTTLRLVDGGDPYTDARKELRSGLAAWLGKDDESHPAFMRHELADYLFQESDWMLPEAWQKNRRPVTKEMPC
ncbi:glycosyltransferase family 9 protein, partial [Desulfovibrio sp. OttesenSCG-928-F20]|nr:glycosyltransferase family 9 protein [Desulfovibrio sp. OttesenSCG-928-F20]